MLQDHLDLLFACFRGKNGFNNNPDVVQLKSALRKILLRNSIVGSKYSNCLTFEKESAGSIFSLKWTRRRTPLIDHNAFSDADIKMLTTSQIAFKWTHCLHTEKWFYDTLLDTLWEGSVQKSNALFVICPCSPIPNLVQPWKIIIILL